MYFVTKYSKLYYEKYGNSNKKLLILPGWGDNRKTFFNIINNLKDKYEIYIIDYPGFGKSTFKNIDMTIYDYAEIINTFMIKNKIINPIIISHSFGGRISSLLISKYKVKVDKLILIDVAGLKEKLNIKKILKIKLYKLLKKIINIIPSTNKKQRLEKIRNKFSSNDYNTLPSHMYQTFKNIINEDLTKYYKNIVVETLIIWGQKDNITKLKYGKKLLKLIKNSALIIYPKADHFSYLRYPILTSKILNSYLK